MLDQVPPQGPHLIDVPTCLLPARPPSEVLQVASQGSTRGLAGRQSVRTGHFPRFWVDRNLGGHSLALHGGCGVNSVLSKDQGGWGGEGGQVTQRVPAVHRSAVHRTWDQPSHSAKI